ncbi:MDR family MFS transporter [Paenibacillus turpanensis]|uniref:MDR family MFS transporter n=1 Tax=Paenibacillus turpanensis TaxID=2689078 RepID=UPI003C7C2842
MVTVTNFMIRPFLVFYLYDKMDGSILLPMLIVGLQPLTGLVMGLWGGELADKYGRKPVMIASLALNMLAMTGFAFAESVWMFAAMAILNGIGHSMFGPAANAQIADVVPEDRRAEVFAALHTAFNVGAAVGPLLGLYVFNREPQLVFALSALGFALFLLLVLLKLPETLPKEARGAQTSGKPAKQPLLQMNWREHRTLLWMTLFMVPVGMLYAQVETTLPLHLRDRFSDDYKWMLAAMLSLNGAVVTLFQVFIANRTEHYATYRIVLLSFSLMVCTALGYGFAPTLALLIVSEVLFSIGEMLIGPHMQKAVSMIAPADMRGRYFSIYSMNWQVSRGLGPVLFGSIYEISNGQTAFAIIALFLVAAGIAQYTLIRRLQTAPKRTVQAEVQPAPVAAAAE